MYLQVHQPYRVKRYRVFDIGEDPEYFNATGAHNLNNEWILKKVALKSYAPTLRVMLELLERHPEFTFALSFSGIVLEQLAAWDSDTLTLFKQVIATGRVEVLSETYYHSLAFFYSKKEFERQVLLHRHKIQDLFGVTPTVFRNTELSYNNDVGQWADAAGYRAVLAEGWHTILGDRSPNFVYHPKGATDIKLLLKNYKLSDDVAFRFGQKSWESWPLTADTYAHWISSINGNGETVNLFMDFETFGEHQWEDTGIFEFLRALPSAILAHPDNTFMTPSQTVATYDDRGEIDAPNILTWADTDRDLTAWVANDMQRSAIESVYALEEKVLATNDLALITSWRRLQTSDHFYYMCTKWSNDGDVHAYFSPYDSPYDAFIAYMNAIKDLTIRIEAVHNKI